MGFLMARVMMAFWRFGDLGDMHSWYDGWTDDFLGRGCIFLILFVKVFERKNPTRNRLNMVKDLDLLVACVAS